MDRVVLRANEIRGLCALVTKIARIDLQETLDRYEAGISAVEHGVLRHLSLGATSMAEISRRMGTAPSTLVYVIDRLAERGLVRRSKDPTDRRREPIVLEKKGAELFSRSPKMDDDSALVRALAQMSEVQQRELVDLLSKFVSKLPGGHDFHQQIKARKREDVFVRTKRTAKRSVRSDG